MDPDSPPPHYGGEYENSLENDENRAAGAKIFRLPPIWATQMGGNFFGSPPSERLRGGICKSAPPLERGGISIYGGGG